MRSRKLLVVSPDPSLIAGLQEGLCQLEKPGRPILLRRYPTTEHLDKLLQQHQPQAVIIGLTQRDTATQLMRHLRETHPGVLTAAGHTELNTELVLASLHAGAREYLSPPFPAAVLEGLLRPEPFDPAAEPVLGRLICFLPACDGCGSSTLAAEVAAALSRQSGQRVLLVDLDFYTSSVDIRLGVKSAFTLLDAADRLSELGKLWERLTPRWSGVDILPPPPPGSHAPVAMLDAIPDVLNSARQHYDWVVCDLLSAVSGSSVRVLMQTEVVYLVTTPELIPLELAQRRITELRALHISADSVRLVANRMQLWAPVGEAEMKRVMGLPVTWSVPNDYDAVQEAVSAKRPISEDSKLGALIREITQDLLQATPSDSPPQPRWTSSLVNLVADLFLPDPDRQSPSLTK